MTKKTSLKMDFISIEECKQRETPIIEGSDGIEASLDRYARQDRYLKNQDSGNWQED